MKKSIAILSTLIILGALSSGCQTAKTYGTEELTIDKNGKRVVVYTTPAWAKEYKPGTKDGRTAFIFPVPDGVEP